MSLSLKSPISEHKTLKEKNQQISIHLLTCGAQLISFFKIYKLSSKQHLVKLIYVFIKESNLLYFRMFLSLRCPSVTLTKVMYSSGQ